MPKVYMKNLKQASYKLCVPGLV